VIIEKNKLKKIGNPAFNKEFNKFKKIGYAHNETLLK
jgi:hypothetical protein